ncbi:MAG: hypothetical protein CMN00_06835 [Rickettsiales bacterium]|nr:hypothetical protein [Rickettsiales bacterium]
MIIGFAGMTHLGLVTSISYANKGFNIVCYDKSKNKIENIKKNIFPISEPKIIDKKKENESKLFFSSDLNALKTCDLVYISSDVLTDKNGNSNLLPLKSLINDVIKVIKKKGILVILSQVSPGFTRNINFPKKRLFYQVETLIFGKAYERASNPERFIIGCYKKNVKNIFTDFLETFKCPILQMKYESAELAKISINIFLVSSISVTNTLSEICESIGADWNEISPSLKLDKRIGKHAYLKPGLGISGGNLERDLGSLIKLGKTKKTNVNLIKAFVENSIYQKKWVVKKIKEIQKYTKINQIAIWGLSYKENTNSIKNSPSLITINLLNIKKILVHDPVVEKLDFKNKNIFRFTKLDETLYDSDLLAILTPWDQYRNFSVKRIIKGLKKPIIIDPYNIFKDQLENMKEIDYYCLGKKINI